MKKLIAACLFSLSLLLAGCGIGGIQSVKAKTENLNTKEELESALGKPTRVDGISGFGASMETYVYETSDGVATFSILNGKIKVRNYTTKGK